MANVVEEELKRISEEEQALQQASDDIIEKCRKFLQRSSDRFAEDISDQERALEIAGGKFWDEKNKKRWAMVDDENKEIVPTIAYNNISPQVNAIASPFSRSPFHVNVVHKEDEGLKRLQDAVTRVEGTNNAKMVYQRAMTRGVCCSAGYIVIGTALDNGSVVPNIEFISNQKMVAFDPDCVSPSGEDAEEGAIVSYIGQDRARREYGPDVIPEDYPKTQPRLSFNGIGAWSDMVGKVQLVKYFRKESVYDESMGRNVTRVVMHTICGDKVIGEPVTLTTDIIPIVRFAGYDDYDTLYGTIYSGYVQRMASQIEQMSLALTMQATRMRRCSNVRIVSGQSAIEGCESYFVDFEKGGALALVYNDKTGASAPQIMNDTFQTGDIASVLQEGRQAMMDCSGVNLSGIDTTQRTAYEVMQQQLNSESNVQELYLHAEAACHTIGKIILGILNNGVVPEFTLEGGPSVITSQMKERSEIQAIESMVSPEHKELLAIRMAETITSSVGKGIAQDLKANSMLKLSDGQDVGTLMNACEQMKAQLEKTMQQLEQTASELEESKKANYQLELQLQDSKAAQRMNMLKFMADMNKDQAQLAIENAEAAKKLAQEDDKIAIQAQREADDHERRMAQIIYNANRNGQQRYTR